MKTAETRSARGAAPPRASTMEPVFPSEPDIRLEGGKLVTWFSDPAGAVVQLTEPAAFTKGMADWLVGPGFAALRERFPNRTDLRILLDLRPMTSREPAARSVVMSAAAASLFMFAQVGVIAPAKPPPLYMTTLHAAVALLSVIGPEIRVFETLEGALQHMHLQAATPH